MTETEGHIALANARSTEEKHLATTNEQIAEFDLAIKGAEGKIKSLQDAIEGQRTVIADARAARAKLRKKRLVFQRAAFTLQLIDQE